MGAEGCENNSVLGVCAMKKVGLCNGFCEEQEGLSRRGSQIKGKIEIYGI